MTMKRILLTVLLLAITISAFSQKSMQISGNVELMPEDTDAINFKVIDDNEDHCALLKVTLSNPVSETLVVDTKGGLNPAPSPTGSNEQNNGEWWFWLSPRVTNIKFMCKGYTETPYIGVSLKKNCVYRVRLTVDAAQRTIDMYNPTQSSMRLTISPSHVLLYYGTTSECEMGPFIVRDGCFDEILEKGVYYYRIENDFYETATGKYVVNDQEHEEVVALKPAFGRLTIDSNPQGADIILDNKPIGKTPLASTNMLKPGSHRISVVKDGYYSWVDDVEVDRDGKIKTLPVITLKPQYGEVICLCDDPSATLTVTSPTGEVVGTGHSGLKVRLNTKYTYKLESSKASHTSQSIKVGGVAIEGRTVTVNIGAPVPVYGGIQVKSVPSRASVYIDGALAGTTPLVKQVLIGRHKVDIKADGYQPSTETVEVYEKQTAKLEKSLVKGPKAGQLNVTTGRVHGATVNVNQISGTKKYTGLSPFSSSVSPGEYSVTAFKNGYHGASSSVTVTDGQVSNLDLRLKKESWLKKEEHGFASYFADITVGYSFGKEEGAIGLNAAYCKRHLGWFASAGITDGYTWSAATGPVLRLTSDNRKIDFQLYAGLGFQKAYDCFTKYLNATSGDLFETRREWEDARDYGYYWYGYNYEHTLDLMLDLGARIGWRQSRGNFGKWDLLTGIQLSGYRALPYIGFSAAIPASPVWAPVRFIGDIFDDYRYDKWHWTTDLIMGFDTEEMDPLLGVSVCAAPERSGLSGGLYTTIAGGEESFVWVAGPMLTLTSGWRDSAEYRFDAYGGLGWVKNGIGLDIGVRGGIYMSRFIGMDMPIGLMIDMSDGNVVMYYGIGLYF